MKRSANTTTCHFEDSNTANEPRKASSMGGGGGGGKGGKGPTIPTPVAAVRG
jgi:hypothetical protein